MRMRVKSGAEIAAQIHDWVMRTVSMKLLSEHGSAVLVPGEYGPIGENMAVYSFEWHSEDGEKKVLVFVEFSLDLQGDGLTAEIVDVLIE